MVREDRTDRAVVMGNSSPMVMKCKCQDGKRKINEQEIENFSIHPNNLPIDMGNNPVRKSMALTC
jgi:hypothetical protein